MLENNFGLGKKNNVEVRPFGIKDKIGYFLGDCGNDFTFIFISSMLMIFYTKVLGMGGAIVGTLFLVSRIIDAFTDIGMGRLVDTLKPAKDGRFRPWIRRMAIPVAVANVLVFLYVVQDWSYNAKIIYMFATYILWGSICYTAINIPYGSMASVIATEAKDRASLSTWRSMGAVVASLLIGIISPLIVYTTNEAGNQVVVPEKFTLLAIVFSACAVVCYFICYKFCLERVKIAPTTQENKVSAGQLAKGLISNKALLAIIGAALVLLLASLLAQTMNTYLFMDYFNNTKMLSLVSFISIVGMIILAALTSNIVDKFGKKEAASVSVLLTSIIYFIMYFMNITNIILFMVLMFIASLGSGFFNMVIWAFITDIIDYQEVRTGSREDGTIYAVYSFARKMGQAIAGGLGGYALVLIGYSSSATVQTQAVKEGIYSFYTLVPAVCYLVVSLILFFFYPLSKKVVEENTAELKLRHEAK